MQSEADPVPAIPVDSEPVARVFSQDEFNRETIARVLAIADDLRCVQLLLGQLGQLVGYEIKGHQEEKGRVRLTWNPKGRIVVP